MSLKLTPNIECPDDFYEVLTEAQRDMTDEEANDMNARLIFVLANQIGKFDDLKQAVDIAK